MALAPLNFAAPQRTVHLGEQAKAKTLATEHRGAHKLPTKRTVLQSSNYHRRLATSQLQA
jgi:hypothetical protein